MQLQKKSKRGRSRSVAQRKSNGGYSLTDNRPNSVVKRQQKGVLQRQGNTGSVVQRAARSNGLPEPLKTNMENRSGFDLGDVTVHRNSDKPEQLMAHAYAQGNEIHLAPGQEKHLPHEAWHVVQQKQGRVKATMQMKGVGVNDDVGLEREADAMGTKANISVSEHSFSQEFDQGSKTDQVTQMAGGVVQRVGTVMVGENHDEDKIEFKRTGLFKRWNKRSQPSKLAAALIQHNDFVPPADYSAELEKHMKESGSLKKVLNTAEKISNGNDPKWGAENGLIGKYSSARITFKKFATGENQRTYIENEKIRNPSLVLRYLSEINISPLDIQSVLMRDFNNHKYVFPIQVLEKLDPDNFGLATSFLKACSLDFKSKWLELRSVHGLLGEITKPIASELEKNFKKAFAELKDEAREDIKLSLGQDFKDPLDNNPIIGDISKKYTRKDPTQQELHAYASLGRTLAQLEGIHKNNKQHSKKSTSNPNTSSPLAPLVTGTGQKEKLEVGYIVGDSHLTDIEILRANIPTFSVVPLKSLLDNMEIVRLSDYGAQLTPGEVEKAIRSAGRDKNLKIVK